MQNIVKRFHEIKEGYMRIAEEQQTEQILLLCTMRPWYGLANYGLEICYALAQYYDVHMWDGDGMIVIPQSDTSSRKKLMCYTYWFDES